MLAIAETCFASVVVMLKRFQLIKKGLQSMVISDQWSLYREDDVGKAQTVREIVLNDLWWDQIDYILSFTRPIYEMLRLADTDQPSLHLVYDWWDTMIEKVRTTIHADTKKPEFEKEILYSVVYTILTDRYYSSVWLEGAPNRVAPHLDAEIVRERNECILRFFPNVDERREVNIEYEKFSSSMNLDLDAISDKGVLDPRLLWVVHGSVAPKLQLLALKILGRPSSLSCCERNWSTCSFINSVKRNKMTPQRGEDLVFVYNNLRLLSRRTDTYREGESKMWDVGGDAFDSLDGVGLLEIANITLDEPEFEDAILGDGEDDGDDVV